MSSDMSFAGFLQLMSLIYLKILPNSIRTVEYVSNMCTSWATAGLVISGRLRVVVKLL